MPHTRLIDALTTPSAGGIDAMLARPVMTLLLRGEPASLEQVATLARLSPTEVRRRLSAMPETEYDEHGRIVGYILTQVETPHRCGLCDTQLSTWCPLDTVIVPRLVQCSAHVTGLCAHSGERLEFVSTPDGVLGASHAATVITVPQPDDLAHLRTAFCRHVRFFVSPDAAAAWLGPQHECLVLSLHEAYELGAAVADRLRAAQSDFVKAV